MGLNNKVMKEKDKVRKVETLDDSIPGGGTKKPPKEGEE